MRLVAIVPLLFATPAFADWTLSGEASTMGFVTIKNGDTAEAHSFLGLSGSVGDDGAAEVTIPLAAVETFIDIRNERMREFLFNVATYPAATITSTVDLSAFDGMSNGDRMVTEIDVRVATNGVEADYPAEVAVTRISDDAVAVSTVRPIITYADELNYEAGVAKLQDIAGLDSISPAVPVTFDLVFTK